MLVRVRIKSLWWCIRVAWSIEYETCIISEGMRKFCSPKLQVPNTSCQVKFTDVFVVPNFKYQSKYSLSVAWNLTDTYFSETRLFNWRTFLPHVRGERLVQSRQWAGVPSILLARMGRKLAWPQQLPPFWHQLQPEKLWVTINFYVSVVWSWMFSRGMKAPTAMAPWLHGCLGALLPAL